MFKFLILAGVSGSGKSYLTDLLCQQYGEIFYKVRQVTTREKRSSENNNDYLFLSDKEYDEISESLVGKTEVNGNRYGSLLDEEEAQDRIGIIILNKSGIEDFQNYFDSQDYISIGINRRIEDLEVKREGRDEDFVKKERAVLDLCDYVINLKTGDYANPHIIKNMVLTHFNQYYDRVESFSTEFQCTTSIYQDEKIITINDIVVEKDRKDFKKSIVSLHSTEDMEKMVDISNLESLTEIHLNGLTFVEQTAKKKIVH